VLLSLCAPLPSSSPRPACFASSGARAPRIDGRVVGYRARAHGAIGGETRSGAGRDARWPGAFGVRLRRGQTVRSSRSLSPRAGCVLLVKRYLSVRGHELSLNGGLMHWRRRREGVGEGKGGRRRRVGASAGGSASSRPRLQEPPSLLAPLSHTHTQPQITHKRCEAFLDRARSTRAAPSLAQGRGRQTRDEDGAASRPSPAPPPFLPPCSSARARLFLLSAVRVRAKGPGQALGAWRAGRDKERQRMFPFLERSCARGRAPPLAFARRPCCSPCPSSSMASPPLKERLEDL
jgi:hypothetical protein